MREPFIDVNNLITDLQSLSDLELKAYLGTLSTNQAAAFTSANKDAAVAAVTASKATNYTNASNMLLGADNSVTSAAYYLLRTQDLTIMNGQIPIN